MQLYFIRHAQSTNNALYAENGSADGRSDDPGLTRLGQMQAGMLAEALGQGGSNVDGDGRDPHNRTGYGITHLYTSLMQRAVMTGAAVARRLGLPLLPWDDLHENGGVYLEEGPQPVKIGRPGAGRAYLSAAFPELELPERGYEDGWWNRPFEEARASQERARRVLSRLLELHGGSQDRVALVSHGGFYNTLLWTILGCNEDPHIWFRINNTAITRLDFQPDEVHLVYLNRVDHLPERLIT